jgi:hypothetical protein
MKTRRVAIGKRKQALKSYGALASEMARRLFQQASLVVPPREDEGGGESVMGRAMIYFLLLTAYCGVLPRSLGNYLAVPGVASLQTWRGRASLGIRL